MLTWINSKSFILLKLVYNSDICSTTRELMPSGPEISTRSLISYGCLTNKNIQDPKNSCAVTENTNDNDRSVVLAVDKIE